jgi:hypothetical protein
MVTDKERMVEWLTRSSMQINLLRKKPRLSTEKRLEIIRENYNVINVLTMVVNGEAYMLGINPPIDISE